MEKQRPTIRPQEANQTSRKDYLIRYSISGVLAASAVALSLFAGQQFGQGSPLLGGVSLYFGFYFAVGSRMLL